MDKIDLNQVVNTVSNLDPTTKSLVIAGLAGGGLC